MPRYSVEELLKESFRRVEEHDWKPRNCVWELTLACNLRCEHCGSRAGKPLGNELSTAECLDVVRQLHELGCELITLSGGEPTLREDWDKIAHAISQKNILVNMVTNGVYKETDKARDIAMRALDAGMCNVGVSIDGPRVVHDAIRGRGNFAKAMSAIERFVAAGLKVAMMTTVNKLNLNLLKETRRLAMEVGADMWRLQLAKPMGKMGELSELILEPDQLLQLIPSLSQLKKQGGISLRVGDSIGYYGAHDKTLRGWGWRGRAERWQGCQAGMQAIGIEADGGVKGCLSLQAHRSDSDPFVEGNLRDASLSEIWYRPNAFPYNRDFEQSMLTGSCQSCGYGSICRGGARCVSSASIGKVTEDPFCFHRLEAQHQAAIPSRAGQTASAAAALALSIGTVGCFSSERRQQPDTGISADASTDAKAPDARSDTGINQGPVSGEVYATDYGVEPPTVAGVYGIEPPIAGQQDYGVEPPVTPDYGIEPSTDASTPRDAGRPVDASTDAQEDSSTQPDAAAEPDATTEPDAENPVDCSTVCCDCDYGIFPQENYEKCCT